jgi:hypothetical protein
MKPTSGCLLLAVVVALSACKGAPMAATVNTTAFANPERVTINGYTGDAMEPFISRDGRYLLFNNLNDPSVNTNLHFAERVDDLTFTYRGEIDGVNTPVLDGVPTMDRSGVLYFVSTRSYNDTFSTVYRGNFVDGKVTGVALVPGVSKSQAGIVNFDVEVSADGSMLYFVDSQFSNGSPKTARLVMAERSGSLFRRKANSDFILQNVNTDALQYAACISQDGLTLFFTRVSSDMASDPAIYMTTRRDTAAQFAAPERLSALTGFVEGPALSPDERWLYYHKKEGASFVIYRVTRQ